MTGIEAITKERQEQIEKHGYSIEDDADEHGSEELRLVAVRALTIHDRTGKKGHYTARNIDCSWEDVEDKICAKSYLERLAIAGALIAAEYDRVTFQQSNDLS